jgi:hypothetical protein
MSRKNSTKKQASAPTTDIEWHDDISDDAPKKDSAQPSESGRLDAMNEIVKHLAHSSGAKLEDIHHLQLLARGLDIDIKALEI